MPKTHIHFGFNLIIYYLITLFTSIEFLFINCFYLLLAESIDLEHFRKKVIYAPRRNPFKAHLIHRNWKIVLIISLISLFYYPFNFIGLGLISHLTLDYLYTKYWLKLK